MEILKDFPGLVSPEKVDSYLEENGILVRRLENGLTVVGSNRFIPDANYAEVNIYFPRGMYFDPKDKRGLLHIYEHLISNRPGKMSKRSKGDYNAETKVDEMVLEFKGVANPNVTDYGYWPIMHLVFNELVYPQIPTIEQLEAEKSVVRHEFMGKQRNRAEIDAYDFANKVLFGNNHPWYSHKETLDSIKAVNQDDIKRLQEQYLIANGVYVRVRTEGKLELLNQVVLQIEDNLSEMRRGDIEPMIFDYEQTKVTNPDFKPGAIYSFDDGVKSKSIEIGLVWRFLIKSYDPRTFALGRFWTELGNRYFEFIRELGYGYTTNAYAQSTQEKSVDGTAFQILRLSTSSVSDYENKARRIFSEFKAQLKLDEDALEDLLHQISIETIAVPILASQRLRDALMGVRFYGRPIDSSIIDKTVLSITKDDLKYWRDRVLGEEPAYIITGDLGKSSTV